jgi:hypothetical protein
MKNSYLRQNNMTMAENWEALLDNFAGNERETILALLQGAHLNRYTNHEGHKYFLLADDSVFSDDDNCLTKSDLLANSEEGCACMYDGLIRTFWPHALPEIGDMAFMFDTKTFSEYAGDRRYSFAFGSWQRGYKAGYVEYCVNVQALLGSKNHKNEPETCEFTLRVSDDCQGDNYDVNYSVMPVADQGASWNNPLHWQEAVDDMESLCASVASGNRATDSKARKAAKKAGLLVSKSRRQRHVNQRGGYQLTDFRNIVVEGANFELTAAAVIDYCKRYDERVGTAILTRYKPSGRDRRNQNSA